MEIRKNSCKKNSCEVSGFSLEQHKNKIEGPFTFYVLTLTFVCLNSNVIYCGLFSCVSVYYAVQYGPNVCLVVEMLRYDDSRESYRAALFCSNAYYSLSG